MLFVAVLFCAAIVWTDFLHRRVPNTVLAAALAAACMALVFGPSSQPALSSRLLGMGLGFVVTLPVYALGRMGAGDVKFLAVAGLFSGAAGLPAVWIVGSLLALVHALLARSDRVALVVARASQWRSRTHGNAQHQVRLPQPFDARRGIPYAAYLAMGLLAWLLRAQ
ncbi:peptidase [Cupriavidus sp. USMAA2-4]|uniref:Peptidase n=1 Tax=Cupriavidus malaysiensis TaxID=367825 RepID=A0ABM6F9W6_9BURK|nr:MULTISPECIES: prepilin peptidase [Cupriavidus]AOY95277.1 peptidase [Cupriavidus sp. USMAA2-4]AOZ01822.1 peptidase [Cupriavidus sp. USMAHM13]AOZ08441.1 peptidase [Cupriavidus malaysiensis]